MRDLLGLFMLATCNESSMNIADEDLEEPICDEQMPDTLARSLAAKSRSAYLSDFSRDEPRALTTLRLVYEWLR